MAHDIFISHSSKDKTIADAMCATFEANGMRCWVAPRDVPPGAAWGAAIVEAIQNSRVMVLIFSDNANTSGQALKVPADAIVDPALVGRWSYVTTLLDTEVHVELSIDAAGGDTRSAFF